MELKQIKRKKNELMFELRRAEKKISNLTHINNDLQEENERLHRSLAGGGGSVSYEMRMRFSSGDGECHFVSCIFSLIFFIFLYPVCL